MGKGPGHDPHKRPDRGRCLRRGPEWKIATDRGPFCFDVVDDSHKPPVLLRETEWKIAFDVVDNDHSVMYLLFERGLFLAAFGNLNAAERFAATRVRAGHGPVDVREYRLVGSFTMEMQGEAQVPHVS